MSISFSLSWKQIRSLLKATFDVDLYNNELRLIPDLRFCIENKIPVIYGRQAENDLVAVGIGCVHWVFAEGPSTNSAWNIGDKTQQQMEVFCCR
jgi:hypothetical protein